MLVMTKSSLKAARDTGGVIREWVRERYHLTFDFRDSQANITNSRLV